MRYLPHTDEDIRTMFDAIGVQDFEGLFKTVPEACRYDEVMDLPNPKSEWSLNSYMAEIRSMMKATPEHRITSYNVCYTKLLRHKQSNKKYSQNVFDQDSHDAFFQSGIQPVKVDSNGQSARFINFSGYSQVGKWKCLHNIPSRCRITRRQPIRCRFF